SREVMNQTRKTFRAIPQTTLRRLRNTPTYFFIVWRWSFWLYALAWIWTSSPELVSLHAVPLKLIVERLLLGITLVETLLATLYTPVFQIFLPKLPWVDRLPLQKPRNARSLQWPRGRVWKRRNPRPLASDEEADILTPLTRTQNPFWDIFVLGLD